MTESQPVSAVVPWEQVCKMLEKVQQSTKDDKKVMLIKFIDQYRSILQKNLKKYPNSVRF